MNRLRRYFEHSFLFFAYRKIKQIWRLNYYLPKASRANLEGVKLDIENLDIRMKERILNGEYEWPEVAVCTQLVQPGESILELGGAIGFVGLYCLINRKVANVTSVEPNPETASRLERNYHLNEVTPSIIRAALASSDGVMHFQVSPEFWTDSLAAEKVDRGKTIEVPTLAFSSILKKANKEFSTLIVDVEGAETCIDWSGLPNSILKVVLEIHPDISGFSTAYRVLNEVINCGFEVVGRQSNVFGMVRTAQHQGVHFDHAVL